MLGDELSHRVLGQVWIGRGQERTEVLGVLGEIGNRLVLLHLILDRHALGVIDKEADVLAPQREERLLRLRAVGGANRLGEIDGVRVERGSGAVELCLTATECTGRRTGGQGDMLAEQTIEHSAQFRRFGCGGGRVGRTCRGAGWRAGCRGRCRRTRRGRRIARCVVAIAVAAGGSDQRHRDSGSKEPSRSILHAFPFQSVLVDSRQEVWCRGFRLLLFGRSVSFPLGRGRHGY